MKLRMFLIIALIFGIAGCAEKEQGVPDPAEAPTTVTPESDEPSAAIEGERSDEFLGHMHLHAKKLDDLNFALADGDLDSARESARWLSRHDSVEDIDSEWMPFLYAMRTQAEAVENASDVETAMAAAEQITAQCQGCHTAAGVVTE